MKACELEEFLEHLNSLMCRTDVRSLHVDDLKITITEILLRLLELACVDSVHRDHKNTNALHLYVISIIFS